MSDRYQGFTSTPIGRLLVKNLGLPAPMTLERYTAGDPLVRGTVLVGGRRRLAGSLPGLLDELGIASAVDTPEGARFKGLVFDATDITSSDQLHALRDFVAPVLRRLDNCPRVVVLGTPPEQVSGAERVAQRALEGFTRSLGKEVVRIGATAPTTPPASRTGPSRSPARSPWSPGPAAASASRSPGSCTATVRPWSGSTCPRPPTAWCR